MTFLTQTRAETQFSIVNVLIVEPLAKLVALYRVWEERAELAHLQDPQLSDLGLTQKDVRCEVSRPFWDVAGRV